MTHRSEAKVEIKGGQSRALGRVAAEASGRVGAPRYRLPRVLRVRAPGAMA